ncbi:MAG: ACP S-malonyltransferase [Thermodesulfobacteriota bacterium]
MTIKIYTASADTKENLKNKIKAKDFTKDPADKVRAALITDNDLTINDFIKNIDTEFEKEEDFIKSENFYLYSGKKHNKACFLFPGQGSQYTNMGKDIKELFQSDIYKKADEIFSKVSKKDKSLTQLLFPEPDKDLKQAEEELKSTDIAQPAIGLTSALYTQALKNYGIYPSAAAGHSFGELSALYSADSFNFENFIYTASLRGKLMSECSKDKDSGKMMAVLGSAEKIKEVIEKENLDLIIANYNSPKQNVVSGESEEIEKAGKIFRKYKLRGISLPVSAAFHSPLVKDAADPFSKSLKETELKSPEIPVTSNTAGNFHTKNTDNIKNLLSDQLISPVLFTQNLKTLFEEGFRVFIEAGPKKVLTDLGKQSDLSDENFFFASADESGGKNPLKDFASVLSLLYVLGFNPDTDKWNQTN